MTSPLRALYDYDALRKEPAATMFVVRPEGPTLVLGSAQSIDVLDLDYLGATSLRQRRGGGGLVLLRPEDLWIDWWIPASDPRWRDDVRVSALTAGRWWADVLRGVTYGVVTVHDGALEGEPAHRVVCFAGRGPGEVFVDQRKVVGVTQWRVREGVFLSTVVHAHASRDIVHYLRDVPDGLERALDHQVLSDLGDVTPEALVELLRTSSGPWSYRAVQLPA